MLEYCYSYSSYYFRFLPHQTPAAVMVLCWWCCGGSSVVTIRARSTHARCPLCIRSVQPSCTLGATSMHARATSVHACCNLRARSVQPPCTLGATSRHAAVVILWSHSVHAHCTPTLMNTPCSLYISMGFSTILNCARFFRTKPSISKNFWYICSKPV